MRLQFEYIDFRGYTKGNSEKILFKIGGTLIDSMLQNITEKSNNRGKQNREKKQRLNHRGSN